MRALDGDYVTLRVEGGLEPADRDRIAAARRPWAVTLKEHRERRSLDANALLWALLGELAAVLRNSKDEVYLEMLERYGAGAVVYVATPDDVERCQRTYKIVQPRRLVEIDGRQAVELFCIAGSSTYDTREFSVLLDGVISECRELGISLLPEDEIEAAKKRLPVTQKAGLSDAKALGVQLPLGAV